MSSPFLFAYLTRHTIRTHGLAGPEDRGPMHGVVPAERGEQHHRKADPHRVPLPRHAKYGQPGRARLRPGTELSHVASGTSAASLQEDVHEENHTPGPREAACLRLRSR